MFRDHSPGGFRAVKSSHTGNGRKSVIIHVWNILNDLAPDDIGLSFQQNMRLGINAEFHAIKRERVSVVSQS